MPTGVASEKYESLQNVLKTVQEQLNAFLIEQEQEMEQRIRRYEEAQRKAYADVQCKARRDKNTLIHLLLSAEQHVENGDGVVSAASADSDVINDNVKPGMCARLETNIVIHLLTSTNFIVVPS